MDEKQIAGILDLHAKWQNGDPTGIKVDLEGADLRGANLWRANLWRANLWRANLWAADLWRANLWRADLGRANLWAADLGGANLWRANLRGANLRGANLRGANLGGADLGGADLRGARIDDKTLWPHGAICRTPPITISGGPWPVVCFGSHMTIGCQVHTYEDWDEFSPNDIDNFGGDSNLWERYKAALMAFRDPEAEAEFAKRRSEQ